MNIWRQQTVHDLARLNRDRKVAEQLSSYKEGFRRHSISLLSEEYLEKDFGTLEANLPITDALNHCRYFKEIYDSLQTRVVSMRLLKKEGRSSYYLHHDPLAFNVPVVRMQIPIVTNNDAYVCITKFSSKARIKGKIDLNAKFHTVEELLGYPIITDNSKFYKLEAGYLYYFDVRKIHTVVNGGQEARITLIIDLEKNRWLSRQMEDFVKTREEPLPQS